ncbi:hypothetical protein [Sorangium sp. So ce1000]|uniref:hypothetical protein n=1 Tax=Sorangium sp. So ce1000 TaxID=3133325 RepID=UPI003F63E9C9
MRAPRALERLCGGLFEEEPDNALRYDGGQMASEMPATNSPATAVAAPFFVASVVSTRMM